MPSKTIVDPTLSSLTLGWIVAHAVDPSILKGTTFNGNEIPVIEHFARMDGADFYEQFVRYVAKSVPSFAEDTGKKLLDTNGRLTQADFKGVKGCFEELSGVRNPWHQQFLGRVVPTIASGPTYIAQILASPAQAIKQVPGINRKLNDDQRVVVEHAEVEKEGGKIFSRAAIQHYMLPSNVNRYLTMVTVGAAYGEGLPQLWGMANVFGEARFTDVQMRIDELVNRDFAYLTMDLEQQGDKVIVNGKTVGRRVSLEDILTFSPNEEYLERPLVELLSGLAEGIDLRPVLVEEDFICNNELVFPAGNYGMPCTRFELEVPHPGLLSRMGYTSSALFGRLADYFRREPEGVYARLSKLSKREIIGDLTTGRERAEKNAALAKLQEAEARAQEQSALHDLDRFTGESSQRSDNASGLAHDAKNVGLDIPIREYAILSIVLEAFMPDYLEKLPANAFGSRGEVGPMTLSYLAKDNSLNSRVQELVDLIGKNANAVDTLESLCRSIMAGGLNVNIQDTPINPIVATLIDGAIRPAFPKVNFEYHLPTEDRMLYTDPRVLSMALRNLVRNAAEASQSYADKSGIDPWVKIHYVDGKIGEQQTNDIHIYQSGVLSILDDVYRKVILQGEKFTTKPGGNGEGFVTSRRYISLLTGELNLFPQELMSGNGMTLCSDAGAATLVRLYGKK